MSLSVLSSVPNPSQEQLRSRDADLKKMAGKTYGNDDTVELAWAEKAYRHTTVYYKLICNINCTKLKLTKCDDELYQQFMMSFPRTRIDVIDEDKLKSVAGKRRWRNFCQQWEYHVEDYNFGTLLRLDCKLGYSEFNTTLVPRVQFLAIEIARNRQGLNMVHLGKQVENSTAPKDEEEKDNKDEEEKENKDENAVEEEQESKEISCEDNKDVSSEPPTSLES